MTWVQLSQLLETIYIETMQIGIQVSHVPHGCHGHVERQVS